LCFDIISVDETQHVDTWRLAITMKELKISTKLMLFIMIVVRFLALTVIAGLTRNLPREKESSLCLGDGGCSSAMTVKA